MADKKKDDHRLKNNILDKLRKELGKEPKPKKKPSDTGDGKDYPPPPPISQPQPPIAGDPYEPVETIREDHQPDSVETYKETEEEIKRAKEIMDDLYDTNVVYTFGYTGSSKTTVIAMLNEYISRSYTTFFDTKIDPEGARLMKESITRLKYKQFPRITPVSKVFEYEVKIKTAAMKDYLPMTFVEMSGELLKRVSLEHGNKLPPVVEAYFSNDDVPILYLLVVGYTDLLRIEAKGLKGDIKSGEDQDSLMAEFINHLATNGYNTDNIGLIISKFDRDKTSGVKLEELVKEKLPRTYRYLLDSSIVKSPKIFDFSVGQVKQVSTTKGMIDQIVKLDFGDCERIVNWMWQVFDERGIFRTDEDGANDRKRHNNKSPWWKKLFPR